MFLAWVQNKQTRIKCQFHDGLVDNLLDESLFLRVPSSLYQAKSKGQAKETA